MIIKTDSRDLDKLLQEIISKVQIRRKLATYDLVLEIDQRYNGIRIHKRFNFTGCRPMPMLKYTDNPKSGKETNVLLC